MMLQIILKYKSKQFYNTIRRGPFRKKLEWLTPLVLIPYFIMLINTMGRIYRKAYQSSDWQRLTEIVIGNMSIICFFIFISTLVLTLYGLFKSKDILLYISLPINNKTLFGIKITETLGDTIKSIILPLPVIIAFLRVISSIVSPIYIVLFVLGWIIIMFQIACISIIFSLFLGKFVSSPKWSYMLRIIAILSALAILLIFMRYFQDTDTIVSPIPFLSIESKNIIFSLFPVSWLIKIIPYEGTTNISQLLYGAIFLIFTVLCLSISYRLFRLRFSKLLTNTMETSRIKKPQYIKPVNYKKMGVFRTFLLKEFLVIKRDPYMLFGLAIPAIMFPAFLLFKDWQTQTQTLYITLVSFMATVSYTLSSIGREGRTIALLRSLPVKFLHIIGAKYALSLILNLSVTIIFILVLSLTIKLGIKQILHNMLIGFISSSFFSSLGLGLASIFPKLDFVNPMRAIAVPGLYAFYIISMIFITTILLMSYINWIFISFAVAFWFIISGILIRIGIRKLSKMDV